MLLLSNCLRFFTIFVSQDPLSKVFLARSARNSFFLRNERRSNSLFVLSISSRFIRHIRTWYLNYPTLLYFLVTIYRTTLNIEGFTVVDEQGNNFRLGVSSIGIYLLRRSYVFVIVPQWFQRESPTLFLVTVARGRKVKGLTLSIEPDTCLRSMFRIEGAIPFTAPSIVAFSPMRSKRWRSSWHYCLTTKSQGVLMDPVTC